MKKLIPILSLFVGLLPLWSQSLDQKEIESTGSNDIVFENYVGPETEVNSSDEILGIGSSLAQINDNESLSWGNKYRVLRSYQPELKGGLDGDILFILPEAKVDHIDNIRRILSGYLMRTFSFTQDKSETLAKFITIYNAVYFQNLDYFKGQYKEGVLESLDPQKVGLSTHFSQWPGKSQIVIPLLAPGDNLISSETKDLDISEISNKEVIKEIQKSEDKGVPLRKEIVEIREDKLETNQKKVDAAEKELKEEKQVLEQESQRIEKALEETEPDTDEQRVLKEEKAQVEQKVEELQQKEESLKDDKKELAKEEKEIFEIRDDVAKDENTMREEKALKEDSSGQEIILKEDKAPQQKAQPSKGEGGFYFILVQAPGDKSSFGQMAQVEKSGGILRASELNSIRGTHFVEDENTLICIAGKSGSGPGVKGVILNKEDFSINKTTDLTVYSANKIWTEGDNLFMITGSTDSWTIAKYSKNLELLARSTKSVNPDTALVFEGDRLYAQGLQNNVLILSINDLRDVKINQ